MQTLREISIAQIKPVPGLFISNRFAALSVSVLKSFNIRYILSITRPRDLPNFTSRIYDETLAPDSEQPLVTKHIVINDDPTEDILCHLKDACDWIEASLLSPSLNLKDEEPNDSVPVGVLLHCKHGISRSGSFIIAYLMRKFSLSYSEALALARESRPLISPNPGFEYQLQVWHSCGYDIYFTDESPGVSPPTIQEKPAYTALKARRDALLGRGDEAVNRARFVSTANLAASFGKRRLQENKENMMSVGVRRQEKENSRVEEKQKAWENVEKMEQEWTQKLISGKNPPWQEKDLEDDETRKSL